MFIGLCPLIQNPSQQFPAEQRYVVLGVQAGQGDKELTELVSCELHIVGKVDWLVIDNHGTDIITPLMGYADVEMMPLEASTSCLCDNSVGCYGSIVHTCVMAHEAKKLL
jgi:hypothetical protein